ncbi:MAG TPA: hypothetical protein VE173_06855 [Longimicrobiales bacterium]|nr:hypothetical protein [Longimicrobiales bacterium]
MPDYRAGDVTISGSSVAVTFSSTLPSSDYRVSLNVTSGNGYTGLLDTCTYFNVTSRTASGFTVEHRKCNGGGLTNVASNTTLDWIAIQSQ